MKKLLVIALAVIMMMAMGLSVAAEISPEAPVISGDTNDSPTSPQTGYTFVLVAAGATLACLTVGGVAAKKLLAE